MEKYPERIVVRLTANQLAALKDLAGAKTISQAIRRLIEEASL